MITASLGRVSPSHKGEYNSSNIYTRLDIVSYLGSSYMVLKDTKGVTPVVGANYQLIAGAGTNSEAYLATIPGTVNEAIKQSILSSGFITIDSFELGATLTQRNQALRHAADGKLYRWAGDLPKTIPASSTPTSSGGFGANAWLEVSDTTLRQELTGNTGITKIGGLNIVMPEQFGAVGDGVTDDTVAVKAAFATGKDVFLAKIYGVTENIFTKIAGQKAIGFSRKKSGFKALPAWNTSTQKSVFTISHDNCVASDFMCDANNVGSAPSNRLHGCVVQGNPIGFSITRVAADNCTGYAHWANGIEGNPKTAGVYYDCSASNSQVLFEQTFCDTVDLYSCTGLATERTLEMFHPYGGNNYINYYNCDAKPAPGVQISGAAGVNIVTLNNLSFKKITFTNCNVYVNGNGSAVNIAIQEGTTGEVCFVGGSYVSESGASMATFGSLKLGVYAGARFEGPEGFNCPYGVDNRTEIANSHILAVKDIGSQYSTYALVTNSANVTVTGGSITAIGNPESQAILGGAVVSNTTRIFPATASGGLKILAEGMGVADFTPDAQTNGFANIYLTANLPSDMSKFNLQLTLYKEGNVVIPPHSLNWQVIEPQFLRVWIQGMDATGYKVAYRWAIIA